MKIVWLAGKFLLGAFAVCGVIVSAFIVAALTTRVVLAMWDVMPRTTLLMAAMAGVALVWGALRSTRRRWSK